MGSTSGGGLSSSELVARGDAICARVHAAYHAHGYISTASIVARAPIVSRDEQAAAREMQELKPPANLAHDWNTIISADKPSRPIRRQTAVPPLMSSSGRFAGRPLLHAP